MKSRVKVSAATNKGSQRTKNRRLSLERINDNQDETHTRTNCQILSGKIHDWQSRTGQDWIERWICGQRRRPRLHTRQGSQRGNRTSTTNSTVPIRATAFGRRHLGNEQSRAEQQQQQAASSKEASLPSSPPTSPSQAWLSAWRHRGAAL